MKNTNDFRYEGRPSHATTKSTLSTASKDEWGTKEDTGKSMKNELCVLRYAKSTCRAEGTSNSEKIKPVALVIIKLCLSEGISQSVTQSVENSAK